MKHFKYQQEMKAEKMVTRAMSVIVGVYGLTIVTVMTIAMQTQQAVIGA
jgi:hypothetical protein